MQFSEATNNTGIVQQVRNLMRVDSNQWPTARIVNSANNWHDFITGYAIGADKNFQWDDSNHTKLPIGTTNLVQDQSDYSFLTDEQGNQIITLTRLEAKDSDGNWRVLERIDQDDFYNALDEELETAGKPLHYDLIADNIVRLYPKPEASVTAGLKFYFQRVGSRFAATDTTKEPGVSQLLHRGYVIASAYDGALTLGLPNLAALAAERQKEEQKVEQYFSIRNRDIRSQITTRPIRFR